jgi:hypothetical protein
MGLEKNEQATKPALPSYEGRTYINSEKIAFQVRTQ